MNFWTNKTSSTNTNTGSGKKLEAMQLIKEGERITQSFFHQMKTTHKQEEIFLLLDGNIPAMETRIPQEINTNISNFYKDLWKKEEIPRNVVPRKFHNSLAKSNERSVTNSKQKEMNCSPWKSSVT